MAKPFLGSEALASRAVSRRALARYDAIYRNVYLAKDAELTAQTRAVAAWLWSGRQATLAGLSAAALYGTQWIDATEPAELYRRNGKPVDGILIHRDELLDDETRSCGGMLVTSPARTVFDLGRRVGRDAAVLRADALAQATGVRAVDVEPLIERHPGVRGLVQLRQVLHLMDGGAESPPETRTRLVLIDAGLPKPRTQIVVHGNFVGRRYARIDMGYEEFKVGVEYEGAQHWTDPRVRANDIERYAELAAQGWLIVRVGAELLNQRSYVIVARVCAALRAHGAQWPVIARILGNCAA